eukprot:3266008-Rhodomonas_salina.1
MSRVVGRLCRLATCSAVTRRPICHSSSGTTSFSSTGPSRLTRQSARLRRSSNDRHQNPAPRPTDPPAPTPSGAVPAYGVDPTEISRSLSGRVETMRRTWSGKPLTGSHSRRRPPWKSSSWSSASRKRVSGLSGVGHSQTAAWNAGCSAFQSSRSPHGLP